MQAVILAAGKGKRLGKLGERRQKAALDLGMKNLLLHNLEILKKFFDEIIVVVGHRKADICDILEGKNVKMIEQKEQLGTAHAIATTEKYIKDNFVVVFGDNILKEEYIKKIIRSEPITLAVCKVEEPWKYGILTLKKGYVIDIVEKPEKGKEPSNLAHAGINLYNKRIFDAIKKTKLNPIRKEYEITDSYKILLGEGEKIKTVLIEKPIHITTLQDVAFAKKFAEKLAGLRHD